MSKRNSPAPDAPTAEPSLKSGLSFGIIGLAKPKMVLSAAPIKDAEEPSPKSTSINSIYKIPRAQNFLNAQTRIVEMKDVFKTTAGIILAIVVLTIAGCGGCALIIAGASSSSDSSNQTVEKVEKKTGKKLTSAQENALRSAQDYVDFQSFSKKGLLQQLTSEIEGYSKADAQFAVNNVKANWNEEAVEAAQSYLDTSSFSRQGLIDQLHSDAGEGFTLAEAQQAVAKVYK